MHCNVVHWIDWICDGNWEKSLVNALMMCSIDRLQWKRVHIEMNWILLFFATNWYKFKYENIRSFESWFHYKNDGKMSGDFQQVEFNRRLARTQVKKFEFPRRFRCYERQTLIKSSLRKEISVIIYPLVCLELFFFLIHPSKQVKY